MYVPDVLRMLSTCLYQLFFKSRDEEYMLVHYYIFLHFHNKADCL